MKKTLSILLLIIVFNFLYGCKSTCNDTINLGLAIILKDKATGTTIKATSQSIIFRTTNINGNVQLPVLKWVSGDYFTFQFVDFKKTGTYTVEVVIDNVSKGSFDVVLGRNAENCNEAVSQIDSVNTKNNTVFEFTKTFVGIINMMVKT